MTGLTACSICRAGTFSTSLGSTQNSSCIRCPQDSYSSGSGAPSLANCTICPANSTSVPLQKMSIYCRDDFLVPRIFLLLLARASCAFLSWPLSKPGKSVTSPQSLARRVTTGQGQRRGYRLQVQAGLHGSGWRTVQCVFQRDIQGGGRQRRMQRVSGKC